HTAAVTAVAFSPNGLLLASTSQDMTTRVWDAKTWQERYVLRVKHQVDWSNSVSFSPDNQYLAVDGDEDNVDCAKLWDLGTGKEFKTLPSDPDGCFRVSYSPDGRRIALGSSGRSVDIRDLQTGREVSRLLGHRWVVSGFAFSPDSKRIASSSFDQTAKI